MSHDAHYPEKIIFEYRNGEDCPFIYTHGLWGGVNAQGEIEMNLYSESDKLPAFTEQKMEPDGSYGPETPPGDQNTRTMVRKVQAKVVMNYHTARMIMDWLKEQMDILDMEQEQTIMMEGGGRAQ